MYTLLSVQPTFSLSAHRRLPSFLTLVVYCLPPALLFFSVSCLIVHLSISTSSASCLQNISITARFKHASTKVIFTGNIQKVTEFRDNLFRFLRNAMIK